MTSPTAYLVKVKHHAHAPIDRDTLSVGCAHGCAAVELYVGYAQQSGSWMCKGVLLSFVMDPVEPSHHVQNCIP